MATLVVILLIVLGLALIGLGIIVATNKRKLGQYSPTEEGPYPKWFILTDEYKLHPMSRLYNKGRILVQVNRHYTWGLATPTLPKIGAMSSYMLRTLEGRGILALASDRDIHKIRPHLDNVIKEKLGYETKRKRTTNQRRQNTVDRKDQSKQSTAPEGVQGGSGSVQEGSQGEVGRSAGEPVQG